MFEIITYNEIKANPVKKQYDKTVEQLRKGDFKSAEVKKITGTNYFRAKLDYENRLLFKFGRHNDETCLLLLEIILNHDYEKSRFLKGKRIDENKLEPLLQPEKISREEILELNYLNPKYKHFHLLDKPLSFDDDQDSIFRMSLPLIIIGSAGSGKTVLTLEKLKKLKGDVLYVTLSPYLTENASRLFYSSNYENEKLNIDFLSFRELLETLEVPAGKELDYKNFAYFFQRHKIALKLKDAHKAFEEIRGVITGMDVSKKYLSRNDYLSLGIKQSIFLKNERESIYTLFERYLQFLKEYHFYDINITSHTWIEKCAPKYDFIVVDEVQDLTNIQLFLILKLLKKPGQFIFCGDSNQVVHPNFFSWSHLKSMFYLNELKANKIKILHTNFRNSQTVSDISNKLLKVKTARFGSIDKESNYLVNSISKKEGEISFYELKNKTIADLNKKTKRSTKYAVIVSRDEDKKEARKYFNTPLLFSVQESKGLEYDNVIIFNMISGNSHEYMEISKGVSQEDLKIDDLKYSRAKDKSDKSQDAYKFYINSLYVAITRAINNVILLESGKKHDLLKLLNLVEKQSFNHIREDQSSTDEWKQEARRLEKQGKTEQVEAIRQDILQTETPPWEPIDLPKYQKLSEEALNPEHYNKKAKDKLFQFGILYNQPNIMTRLADLKYRKAENYEKETNSVFRKHLQLYVKDDIKQLVGWLNKYGIDFRDEYNFTPLQCAVYSGAEQLTETLLKNGANPDLFDTFGRTPLQIALSKAFYSQDYAEGFLAKIYPLLQSEALKIKVDNKLLKIDSHKIEFFIINLITAIQSTIIQKKGLQWDKGIVMNDLLKNLSYFPENVLPEYRKKRTYLNAIFAKHEINSNNPYNKKLFVRIERGLYKLNDDMFILKGDDWLSVNEISEIQNIHTNEATRILTEEQRKKMEEEKRRFEKMGWYY